MARLFTVKTINELSREELEAILDGIRIRRIAAAAEYVRGKNQKYAFEIGKLSERIGRNYDMLAKELTALDRAMEKCEKRLVEIDTLKQSQGLISDMMVVGADDDEEE